MCRCIFNPILVEPKFNQSVLECMDRFICRLWYWIGKIKLYKIIWILPSHWISKLLLQMEMHIKYQFQHATAKLTMADSRSSTREFQRQILLMLVARTNQEIEKNILRKGMHRKCSIGQWNNFKTEAGIKSDEGSQILCWSSLYTKHQDGFNCLLM